MKAYCDNVSDEKILIFYMSSRFFLFYSSNAKIGEYTEYMESYHITLVTFVRAVTILFCYHFTFSFCCLET